MRNNIFPFVFLIVIQVFGQQCCINNEVTVNNLNDLNTQLNLMITNSSTTATTITIQNGTYDSGTHHDALFKQINTNGGCPCKIQAETDNEVNLKGKLLWRMYNAKNLTIQGINFEKTNENTPRGTIEMLDYYGPIENINIIDCNFSESGIGVSNFKHYIQALDDYNNAYKTEKISIRGCSFEPSITEGHYLDFKGVKELKIIGNSFSDTPDYGVQSPVRYISLDVKDTNSRIGVENSIIKSNTFNTKYKPGHYLYDNFGVNNIFKNNTWQEENVHLGANIRSYIYIIYGDHHKIEDNNFLDKYSRGNMIDIANLYSNAVLGVSDEANKNHHSIINNRFDNMVLSVASSMLRIGNTGYIDSEAIKNTDNINSGISVLGNTFSNYNNLVSPTIDYFEVISNKSAGNTYKDNTLTKCRGGLFLRAGDGITVDSNKFIGTAYGTKQGISVSADDHLIYNNQFIDFQDSASYPIFLNSGNDPSVQGPSNYDDVTNCKISFNTFTDCRYNIFFGLNPSQSASYFPSNNFLDNNIINQNSAETIPFVYIDSDYSSTNPTEWNTNTFRNNIFYENNQSSPPHLIVTDDFSLPNASGNHLDNEDPNLILEGNIYKPDAVSIALNSAFNTNGFYDFVSNDIVGNSRGSSKDIGSYETDIQNKTVKKKTNEQESGLNLQWYPNPTSESFKIDGLKTSANIYIYNINGKLVLNYEDYEERNLIEMNHLVPGMYLVKIVTDNSSKTIKLYKE